MSYCGYITRLKDVEKHSNADRLQVAKVFGNSVVIGLNMKEGDMVLYFPTDGKLGEEFAKENNLLRISGSDSGGYMDAEKRNVTSIRLRGEKSDGLIMSLESLSKYCDIATFKEGDTITTLKGTLICEKYIPRGRAGRQNTQGNGKNTTKKEPKETYPLFTEHVDTSQLAYNTGRFEEGDTCYITLKLHGTSQRTSHTIKEEKRAIFNSLRKALSLLGVNPQPKKTWENVSGTRRVTLKNYDGGFYGGNQFRKQWHDTFHEKLQKGETAYYEVVGFTDENKLIMPECSNKKTKDKEFIKQYGDTTRFTYGCEEGQSDIYVYRMTMTNEDGHVVEYPTELVNIRCEQMGVKSVPVLDKFIFTTVEDLMERVNKFEDGEDPVGKTHLREGVIVRIEGKEKFTALKHKSFNFKVLEGIVKSEDVLDIEEAESSEEERDSND